VPDFKGSHASVETVVRAPVDIYNHNVETVPSLYRKCRPGGHYRLSLEVLSHAKRAAFEAGRALLTKTGIMLGLGEERWELMNVLSDLRAVDCDILTLGQYLRPSQDHLPVVRYLPPAEFEGLRRDALALGFRHVEAGPLVRSSYHAWEHVS
jgi:lipoic acid synthetase